MTILEYLENYNNTTINNTTDNNIATNNTNNKTVSNNKNINNNQNISNEAKKLTNCHPGEKGYLRLKDGVHKIICKGLDKTGKIVFFTDDLVPPNPSAKIRYVTVQYWKVNFVGVNDPKKIEFLKRYDK